MSVENVEKLIKDNQIEFVDLRLVEHKQAFEKHFALAPRQFDPLMLQMPGRGDVTESKAGTGQA